MREIKFRAWNESAKRYSKPFGLKSTVLNFTDDDGLGVIKSLTTESVEQYTGLKDKNGVEIYENDIVRYADDEPNIVTFEECCFGYRVGSKTFLKLTVYNNVNKLEVIGNIHETK